MFAWDMVGRSNFLQLLHRPFDAGLNVDSVPKLPCSYTAKDHMSWRLFRCIADSNKELSQPNKQLSNQQGRTPAGIS